MVEGTNGETGETLMNIHLQVFTKKRLQFQKEILPFHLSKESELGTDLLSYFDRSISESVKKGDHGQVVDGRLFNFIQANIKSSEKYCATVYSEEYNKTVRPKVENAVLAQIPVTIEEELTLFCNDYYRLAKGPAADEIFKQLRTESVGFEEELSLIPGPVRNLKVVGASSDRIKLKWEPPEVNAATVEKYVVMIKSKGKDWEEVASQAKCSSLITGLQSSTWYCFAVLASNAEYTGGKVSLVKAKTGMSETTHKALGTTFAIASPITVPSTSAYLFFRNRARGEDSSDDKRLAPVVGLIGIVPVLGQIMGYILYKDTKEDSEHVQEEQDTEVLRWTPASGKDFAKAKTFTNRKELYHVRSGHSTVGVSEDPEDLKNYMAIFGSDLEDSDEEFKTF